MRDNWEAIEASRCNQNGDEEKITDNDDTDSDKTEARMEESPEKVATVDFSTAHTAQVQRSVKGSQDSSTSRSTFNKNRPCSRRIRRHTTNSNSNSKSKSTTGEDRNTNSSQRLNEVASTFQRVGPMEDSGTMTRIDDGTLRVAPVLQKEWSSDGNATFKVHADKKSARFDTALYFENNQFDASRNPILLYDLVQLLGEGSYGRVYKGNNKATESEVAIKIIPCDNQSDVTSEIEFLRKLKCPYIVSFIDGFLFEEELWIVMEFCAGGSLSDLKEITKVNLTESQLKLVLTYCTLGLRHLHGLMSIHRDIKAGNILLTIDGLAKLADFGVSAQMQSATQKRRTVIGTPFWMAPEVIQETSYDSKADIWSLGITALELCEGRPPHFEVHPMRAIFLIPIKPAPRLKEPSRWSADMNDFMSKCLVKEADSRWSADALLSHPWIKRLAMDVEHGRPPNDLKLLVSNNIELVYRARELRRSSKFLFKRSSAEAAYDTFEAEAGSPTNAEVESEDHRSVATMNLGMGSRETSLSSDRTEQMHHAGSDDTAETFMVRNAVVNKSSEDDHSTAWFTVDSMRASPGTVEEIFSKGTERSSISRIERMESDRHEIDEQCGDDVPVAVAAKEYFNNVVTKQVRIHVFFCLLD